MRRSLALLLSAGLSVLVACGGDDEKPASALPTASPANSDATIAFKMREENRSGSSGTATLNGGDRGFTVSFKMKRAKNSGPAHIHNVTCESYRALKDFDAQLATIHEALTDVVDGKSKTRIEKTLSQYRTSGFSINVHSYEGGFPVVAWGNIPNG
jgi:hypothetical protein